MQDKPINNQQPKKRVYQKPELVSFELFERRSLTCSSQVVSNTTAGHGACHYSFS